MGERREEILTAALDLFSHRRAETVSIDDVARRAGASRALVYHYFSGKRELYVEALRMAADELGALLQPPEVGGPLDRLAVGLHSFFDYAQEHAAGFAALLRGGPGTRDGDIGGIVAGVRAVLFHRITEALGVAEPGPVLRISLRAWIASVEATGLDWLDRQDLPRDVLEPLLVDQMVALLHAAAAYDPQVADVVAGQVGGRGPAAGPRAVPVSGTRRSR